MVKFPATGAARSTRSLVEKDSGKRPCGTMWQSFIKNAGTACGKLDIYPFYNGFHVPGRLGTSLGQVGTDPGHGKLSPVFATVGILSRCVGRWDSGTNWDKTGTVN